MRKLTYLWQCCGVFADTLHCPECGCSLFDNPSSSDDDSGDEEEAEKPTKSKVNSEK